ncbi:unnamed protein product [Cuscuta campestris]|uniref:RING-type domain-containing protein n=1 Tax=Cuscuta campestris TaxID=132261 RepID=A0A484MH18_9ASTE|nr:unnamed protein product [Cuscuta campestris]
MLLSSVQPVVFQSSGGQFTSPSAAGNGQFSQRIAEHLLHKEAAHPPQTGLHQDQSRRPARFPTVPASGPSHDSVVPIHIDKKLSEPDFVPGGGMPTSKDNPFPQVSNIRGQPSFKRKSREPAPSHPRMKISHRPSALPVLIPRPPTLTSSSPQPLPHLQVPRRPPLTPSPTPHLKWQGPGGPPKPTGHKCLLCKRDLALSPDGPAHQPPPILPAVAVLPCGHVFHDHCLHLITPEDQSNDPPCIPCVIGET